MKLLSFILLLILSLTCYAESENTVKQKASAETTLNTLQTLLESSKEKAQYIDGSLNKPPEPGQLQDVESASSKEIDEIKKEIIELQDDLESVATGISVKEYRQVEQEKFDLKSEVENLLQPMVYALKSITADSRKIEKYKQDLELINRKLKESKQAIKNLKSLVQIASEGELKLTLVNMLDSWEEEKNRLDEEQKVTKLRLDKKLESKGSFLTSTTDVFAGFFKNRGLNLLLGLLAFFGVFFLLRLFYSTAKRLWFKNRNKRQTTFDRLIDLIFNLTTFLAAMMATLFIFNLRNDWLLLGIGALFLVALGWILLKTLPSMVEKVMLLLNLGSVREGERVIYNGVPWLVDTLHFYSHLINPELTGGSVHVPARELAGLVSRPSAMDEEWFPSKVGEWVHLDDETLGQVVYQSPEMVELEIFGGSHKTYTTENYLGQNPKNLSRDYRIQMVFGIDYKHQALCTTEIPEKMTAMFKKDLLEIMDEDQLNRVVVDFFQPNASSLDYEYEAYVKGSSAHLYEEVERTMIYSFVNACNKYGWEIPFQQITLHQKS